MGRDDDGSLYSRVYHAPQQTIEDSARFRVRLIAYFEEESIPRLGDELARLIQSETGVAIPTSGSFFDWELFFKTAELRDLLDALTLTWQLLKRRYLTEATKKWRSHVNRTFTEEGLGFYMNENGGVRRVVDEQFEQARRGALAALDAPRYSNARDCFEEAHRHLASVNPHYKASVRSMFECIEALVRLLIGGQKLESRTVRKNLLPLLKSNFADDQTGALAIEKLGESLCDWIDSAHFYRHGQAQQQPVEPSDAYCVYVLTSGSGWARWLVALDQQLNSTA